MCRAFATRGPLPSLDRSRISNILGQRSEDGSRNWAQEGVSKRIWPERRSETQFVGVSDRLINSWTAIPSKPTLPGGMDLPRAEQRLCPIEARTKKIRDWRTNPAFLGMSAANIMENIVGTKNVGLGTHFYELRFFH